MASAGVTLALGLTAGAATAAPGKGNGSPPSHAGSGNPHAPGETGNPHTPGGTGDPHEGGPPYGVANGHRDAGAPKGGGSTTGGGSGTAGASAGGSDPVTRAPGGNGNGNGNAGGNGGGQEKTTICHRTGSEKNPFVKITVANPALKAHAAHGDIIPAPGGSCDENDPAVAGEVGGSMGGEAGLEEGTLGGGASSGGPGDPAAAVTQDPAGADTLPFTGFAALVLACIGIVLAASGLTVRAINRGSSA